jgi:NADH-quinone oxidoreductase subunit N
MLASVLAAAPGFTRPDLDWHALAPELILTGTIVVALLVDLVTPDRDKALVSSAAGIGLLGAIIPLITLHLRDAPAACCFWWQVVQTWLGVLPATACVGLTS